MFNEMFEKFSAIHPPEAQRLRKANFWMIVADTRLYQWTMGDDTPQNGIHLRLGIAPSYSSLDIQLADKLLKAADENSDLDVGLFDITDLHHMSDLQLYIPELEKAFQTPVVGIWKDGNLINTGWGFKGRELVLNELNLRTVRGCGPD